MYTISKIICLFVCIVGVICAPNHSETCSYWERIARGYSSYADEGGSGGVTCQAHQSCNGFNCSGGHSVTVPVIQNLNLSFCFGLTINHCDNPPSVDYYLQLASPRVEETYERVKVNESKPIGNLSFGTANIHIRPYLFFIYTKESNSILFEVKIKCKVTTYGIEEWPEQFQLTVFPRREIPYTPCSGTETVPPIQKPPKCIPYVPSGVPTAKPHTGKPHPTKYPPHVKPTNAPVPPAKSTQISPTENTMVTTEKHTINVPTTVTTATQQTVKPNPSKFPPLTKPTKSPIAPKKSKTLGKPCTLGEMQGATCGVNETCVGNGDKDFCDCQLNFKKENGACKRINDHGPILPTWKPPMKKTTQATTPKNIQVSTSRVVSHQASGTKINMTALVVGSVLGGLIVIVLIATIIVFVVRKRRMYYRGHQLLLTEEDTDVVI